MVDWNKRFVELSVWIASWSKDTSRGVGAVIADKKNRIISVGYNGFPRGADDEISERYERPQKYDYTEHAERNAIYSAASHGIKTSGCILYLEWYPCPDCARAIIQSGISKIVCGEPDFSDSRWGERFRISQELLTECGVEIEYVNLNSKFSPGYYIGQKVSHPCDSAPFEVTGITRDEIQIMGDFSGGTHNVCQKGWVSYDEVKPYH